MFFYATLPWTDTFIFVEMEGKDKGNIIGNILGNNRKAQMAFYDDYAKMLYATCFRILGNREEAEEAMQDSFLKIFESIGTQYVENGALEAWMRRIASHTAIDYLRRSKPEWDFLSEDLPDEPEADVDETFLDRSVDEIKAAMNRLAEGYRVVLSLYLFEGYDMEEIASILKIRPASVRSQYLRAKRKLLEIISNK